MNANYLIFAQTAAPQTVSAPQTTAEVKTTTGTEQKPDAKEKPQGSFMEGLGGMIPFILIIVVMFYLMYRGQKKEQKRRQDMMNGLKKDDQIVTVGGIKGVVSEIRENFLKIKIAPNVEIEVAKTAVGSVVNPENTEAAAKK